MPDAPRPPFDRLDAMAPPDQWAEVADRIDDAPTPTADAPLDGPARPTTRRWALAAAAAVLLAGATGVVLDRDEPSSVVADGGAAEGCPFTFLRAAEEMFQPSAGELMLVAGTAPGSDTAGTAVQHFVSDDGIVQWERTVEVDVIADDGAPPPDPSVARVGPSTWLDLYQPVGRPRPGCELIQVRIDVSAKAGTDPPPSPGDLDLYYVADFVADVLALTPLDPELVADEPCSFTLDGDPTLGPLAPVRPGDAAPYDTGGPWDLYDDPMVAGGWQRVEVDGNVALVAVGGYGTGPREGWVADSPGGSTGAAKMLMSGNRPVADSGWCTDAVVHLLIPLTDEQVAAAEADFDSDWMDVEAARATIGRILDAIRLEGSSPPTMERPGG